MQTNEPREFRDSFLILPKTFTHKEFVFKQIRREGLVAIYQKYKENHENKEHYETINIFRYPKRQIGGKEIEPKEGFPSSELWGTYGFSYTNLTDATKKFNELIEKNRKNE